MRVGCGRAPALPVIRVLCTCCPYLRLHLSYLNFLSENVLSSWLPTHRYAPLNWMKEGNWVNSCYVGIRIRRMCCSLLPSMVFIFIDFILLKNDDQITLAFSGWYSAGFRRFEKPRIRAWQCHYVQYLKL